jgi:hypothetical protein
LIIAFADDLHTIFHQLLRPKKTGIFSTIINKEFETLMKLNISSPPVFCLPWNKTKVDTLDQAYFF